jgi:Tfp pilus assembly protein PilX
MIEKRKETGSITIIALMILIILTVIGISVSKTSNTDILAARNQIPYAQNFYIAEGAQNKEAIKISRGDYPVIDLEDSEVMLEKSTGEITAGISYDYEITYKGAFPPPSGYSILHFKRFDYGVKTRIKKTGFAIKARYCIIGPKAE